MGRKSRAVEAQNGKIPVNFPVRQVRRPVRIGLQSQPRSRSLRCVAAIPFGFTAPKRVGSASRWISALSRAAMMPAFDEIWPRPSNASMNPRACDGLRSPRGRAFFRQPVSPTGPPLAAPSCSRRPCSAPAPAGGRPRRPVPPAARRSDRNCASSTAGARLRGRFFRWIFDSP